MPSLFVVCLLWLAVTCAIIAADLVRQTRRNIRRHAILMQLSEVAPAEVKHAA